MVDAKKKSTDAFEMPRVSKRSMKKIKVNGGNGTRVVFDEDTGEALNPLVQMMRSGLGSKYEEVRWLPVSAALYLPCAVAGAGVRGASN